MGRLLNAFRTTAGEIFRKKEDSAGRVYYVKDGEGRISRQAWAGANRSLEHIVTDEEDRLPAEIREARTAEELERVTQIPFTQDFIEPISDGETKAERLAAEGNRFLGFWSRNRHLSRDEAAQEYIEFRNELRGVEDPQARAIIKWRYNIGGS